MDGYAKWKGIQSWQELERVLHENPEYRICERRGDKDSRFVLQNENGEFINTVDGRSFRALLFRLHSIGGGIYKLRPE